MKKHWTSFTAFMVILLFAGALDGLMDVLGLGLSMVVGLAVMALAWVLVELERVIR